MRCPVTVRLAAPVLLAPLLALLLVACPPSTSSSGSSKGTTKENAAEPCKKVGDTCEYSPGKLGSCVLQDSCTAAYCFVCQSQH
jgi:hypothetical protein